MTDIDLAALSSQQHDQVREALGRHGVLFFPQQALNDETQLAFAHQWAEPKPHPVRILLGVDDVLESVENSADKPPQVPTGRWAGFHTDYTFAAQIAEVAVLRADVVPPTGGDTVWASTAAAWDSLSQRMQDRLLPLTATHHVGPKFLSEMERTMGPELTEKIRVGMPEVSHPVVISHPHTGRRMLFVNPAYTSEIDNMTARESETLLALLYDTIVQPRFSVSWRWSVGDVAMWDEFSTLHSGPSDFAPHERRLRRITAGRLAPTQ